MNPSYGPFVSQKLALEKGLKHYFTGKPCKRGHISTRFICSRNCCQCLYESNTRRDKEQGRVNGRKATNAYRSRIKENHGCSDYTLRKRNDPYVRLVANLRRRVLCVISSRQKSANTMEQLGCSRETLLNHLSHQFDSKMTWDNMGEWHIDHIRPCASFDLTDPAQQRECFHYTNLQPLWAEDNLKKGASINPDCAAACCPAT